MEREANKTAEVEPTSVKPTGAVPTGKDSIGVESVGTKLSGEDFTSLPKSENFKKKLISDFKDKETWKLKCIYFFLLSGIVILWVQLSVHQKTLNLSDRDISDFVATSSVFSMITPFASGLVADKIGNFSFFVCVLMISMGINSFIFIFIPPIKTSSDCFIGETVEDVSILASNSSMTSPDDTEMQIPHRLILKYCSSSSDFNPSQFGLSAEDFRDVNCTLLVDLKSPDTEYRVNNRNSTMNASGCSIVRDEHSYLITYWSYIVVRTSLMLFMGASYTLFDGAVMVMDKELNVDYGLQRAWGTLAALVSSYLGGILVDSYSPNAHEKDFTLMFIVSGVCFLIAGVIMFFVNMQMKLPATSFSKSFLGDLYRFEAIALLIIVFMKGLFMGYAETFMYIYMFSLGASSTLIGLTVTVGSTVEILLQVLATPITKVMGKPYVIAFGVFLIAIRFLGFSYTYDPRVIVGLEVLDGWASGLTFTAMNMYVSSFASTSTIASIRGLIGVMHGGIGKFLSAKIGIEIKEEFGDQNAWKVMALWALASSIVYAVTLALYRLVYLKSKRQKSYDLSSSKGHLTSTSITSN